MTFRLGTQKMAKNNQDNQMQITCNFMQYVFFEKGVRNVQWGLGQNLRSWGILKVTFSCKLQKKLGDQAVLVSPPVLCWGGATALSAPRSPRLW